MQSSKAVCGGVIRDSLGSWVVGFARSIGDCASNSAEEWAVVEGLQLAWDLGFRKIILEFDADETINLILDHACISCSNLVLKARDLLSFDWQVDVRVIPRDFNCIADELAKRGLSSSDVYSVCPSFLRNWVDRECLGINSPMV